MKHIYIFNEASRAAVYGIGTYIRQMACALKELEHYKITIVELRHSSDEVVIEIKDNIRYMYIPSWRCRSFIAYDKQQDLYYQSILFLLLPYIDKNIPNIFHFNFNFNQCEFLVNQLKSIMPNCKTVLTIHYQGWCFMLKGNTSYFKSLVRKEIDEGDSNEDEIKKVIENYKQEKSLFQAVDHIICLSKFTKKILCNEYDILPQKLSIIYNGLQDDGKSLNQEQQLSMKRKYLFPTDSKIILFVGRLDDIKGVEFLIQAFKKVLEDFPECFLVIAGDGNFGKYIKEADTIWQRVIFTGRLDKDKLYELYQIADLGVMLSFHEQCSYVAIEMLMHGIPLIATDSTGLKEVIKHGENGYVIPLVEEKNTITVPINKCTKYIKKTLQKDRRQWALQCRQTFENRYRLERMQSKIIKLYSRL